MGSELADFVSSIFGSPECSGTSSSEDQSAGAACLSPPTDVFHNLTITDHVNRGLVVDNKEPHLNILPESQPNLSHLVNDYNNQPGNQNEFHQSVHELCSGCVTQNGGVFPQNGSCLLPYNNVLHQNYDTIHQNHFVQQNDNCLAPNLNFGPQNVMNTHQSAPNCNFGACSSTSTNKEAPYRPNTVQNGPACLNNSDTSQHDHMFHCQMLQNPTTASFNPRQRRTRTKFTEAHLDVLEKEFIAKQFITRIRRHELANQLNLNDKTIKIWFQNRRVRNKRLQFVEDTPST